VSSSEPSTDSPLELPYKRVSFGEVMSAPGRTRARDGSVLWWGEADTPGPPAVVAPGAATSVKVAVSPVRPGHAVSVEYRVNGGPVRQAIALPEMRVHEASTRIFRAILPEQPDTLVEFLPVLRLAGQPISPRLGESAASGRYQVSRPTAPVAVADASTPSSVARSPQPCWAWDSKYLGSLTATLRKELVGATPDGLRIDWHVEEGSFAGPGLSAKVLPGATDWMRVRNDGVAIVSVQACLETQSGVRIYCSYGGRLDLGPDGYARALRNQFDPLPPLVVTPTFATADKRLEWVNRAQCIGVGRALTTEQLEFDVYLVSVGARKQTD
jgi:hypothetical protein